MGRNKRVQSKTKKSKLDPIPHNNRVQNNGSRLVVSQTIKTRNSLNPDKKTPIKDLPELWFDGKNWRQSVISKTIHHMNLSSYEQQRIHMIKVAVEKNDPEVLTKLNHRERMLYDKMLKEKNTPNVEGIVDNQS